MTFNYHEESCRAIEFSPDGNVIYTGSKDKSIAIITNGLLAGRLQNAHDDAIYTL